MRPGDAVILWNSFGIARPLSEAIGPLSRGRTFLLAEQEISENEYLLWRKGNINIELSDKKEEEVIWRSLSVIRIEGDSNGPIGRKGWINTRKDLGIDSIFCWDFLSIV
ncbi:hypothetical protein AVEN_250134-1 [Araneus ventricosus]|uniref:Uncharacterized protein n=1 Tax=Araneus ventricosus TaxID=182803 RepID=A0A4Y2UCE5_ARAVE|nr:hypothetical protein AVEN_250134-1 [Araneus ventricosus]